MTFTENGLQKLKIYPFKGLWAITHADLDGRPTPNPLKQFVGGFENLEFAASVYLVGDGLLFGRERLNVALG